MLRSHGTGTCSGINLLGGLPTGVGRTGWSARRKTHIYDTRPSRRRHQQPYTLSHFRARPSPQHRPPHSPQAQLLPTKHARPSRHFRSAIRHRKLNTAEATPAGRTVRSCPCPILTPHWLLGRRTEMTAGSLMAAELAQQPEVLGRLVGRHASDRDQVRAVLPGRLAGTVLLARGSSDNVAVYGRYLIELASRRPAGLAAPSVHTRYQANVDYTGYLAVALSQSGVTPEIVETAARMRRSGAAVVGITNESGSPLTQACDLTLLTEAGPELAVPATKTVTAQMLAVAAIAAAYDPSLVPAADLAALPDLVSSLLADSAVVAGALPRAVSEAVS